MSGPCGFPTAVVRLLAVLALAFAAGLACAGTASASADLEASVATVGFNDHGIHDGNYESQTVQFTNISAGSVTPQSAAIVGSGAYSISSDGCSGTTLNGTGDFCMVTVQFSPTTVGPHSGTLSVTDPSGASDVALNGNGITGSLTADPNPPTFNTQPYFYGGQQQGLNLNNPSGSASTQVSSITITGADAAHFYIAWGQNCATQLINNGSGCSMGVGFDPGGAPGSYNAQLEIASDAADSPLIVPLSATALAGPHQAAAPNPVAFGAVNVGQEASRTVTLSNDGDFPMQTQQLIVVTGRPDVFFLTGDTCTGQIVNPGQSCAVVLHFKPSAGGAQDASLFVVNGNQNPPVSNIGMNGYGVEPSSLGQKSSGTTSGTVAPDTTPPAVSGYGLTNSTFVVDGVPTPFFGFAAAKKRSRGTTFEYRLSEAGFVNITITQSRSGRRRNKACLAPSRSLRRAKKCTRITTLGTLTRVSYHGINRIAFSGRLGTSALKPGRYQATLTATDAARNTSKPKTISFTIGRR